MEKIYFRKALLSFVLMMLISFSALSQQTLWVGQTYRFDVTSSVLGLTANISWSTSGGYISLNGSGFYRDITVTQYFSGTATVTCEWDYKLTGNGKYTHVKRQFTITCRDNKVSISPTTLNMVPGQTQYVSYRHQYDNQYTSAANAYYQSSDPSICTVSQSGQVIAIKPGTTYINVYSKISSVSPYCKVTVSKIDPTAVEIPSSINLIRGAQIKLTPTLTPLNATTDLTWYSSDEGIATVSSSGVVTGISRGNASIFVVTRNELTAQCNVVVDNPKLELFCSHESGIVKHGCEILFNSTVDSAQIYYTLDNTTPTTQSVKYTSPIVIEKPMTIKAIAVCDEYYPSDVLERNFEESTLDLIKTNVTNNGIITDNVLYFKFNEDIQKGALFIPQSWFQPGMYSSIEILGQIDKNGRRPLYPGAVVIEDDMLKIYCDIEYRTVIDLQILSGFFQSKKGEQFEDINITNIVINDYLNQSNLDLVSFKFSTDYIEVAKGDVFIPEFDTMPAYSKYSSCKFYISDETVVSTYRNTDRCFYAKNEGKCEITAEITLNDGSVLRAASNVTVLNPNASIDGVNIDKIIKTVKIYTLQGILIYDGSIENIPPLKPLIYIYQIGNVVRKVMIK